MVTDRSMDIEIRPKSSGSPVGADDPQGDPAARGRETKIHALLRQGDALLRGGRYQQAIHVWTRILFLDRRNRVAREAIEKAKRLLAERQRELDVMVLDAARCLRDGERRAAKRLLGQVLLVDPRHTEGRSLSERLETMERRGDGPSRSMGGEPDPETSPRRRRRTHSVRARAERSDAASPLKMASFLFCALCLLALGGLYLHLNWDVLVDDRAFASTEQAGWSGTGERDGPDLPSLSELHYYNGVRLFSKGQYRQALSELRRVGRQSGVFEEARGLVLRIEQRLLRDATTAEAGE